MEATFASVRTTAKSVAVGNGRREVTRKKGLGSQPLAKGQSNSAIPPHETVKIGV
jgi:hypothetical protein